MKYVTVTFYDIDKFSKDFTLSEEYQATYNGYMTYMYTADEADIVENATHAMVVSGVGNMQLARILHIGDVNMSNYTGKLKEVIATLSVKSYIDCAEKKKRAAAIRKDLETKVQKALKARAFRDVLKDDEEAQKLIEELDLLEGKK